MSFVKQLPDWFQAIYQHNNGHHVENNQLIITSDENVSETQKQTSDSFGYQWSRTDLFDQKNAKTQVSHWLSKRFGSPESLIKAGDIILDAGCGGGSSALAYFGSHLKQAFYVGNDISSAVEVAHNRFMEQGIENSVFIRSDLNKIPLVENSVDVIFSEGVLHHTDNAKLSFQKLQRFIKKGGKFVFYIYKKKAPIREFTDDFIRNALQSLSPEEKFDSLMPLTKLGNTLGELDIEIEINEPVEMLGIPAGKINLQRLFFYYIFKCFYKEGWSLEQMNLTNFDWYSPQNCSRHTKEEVRQWFSCQKLKYDFEIEREYIDDSGLSYIVRKK